MIMKGFLFRMRTTNRQDQWMTLLRLINRLLVLLIPCWLFIVFFLYLLPIRFIKGCLYPSAWTFNRIGEWLLPFIDKLQLRWILKKLPIYNVLQWLDLGYTSV